MRTGFCVTALAALALLAGPAFAQSFFPARDAAAVNPDVQLKLTFSQPPVVGKAGQIRIYDAADDKLVDTLDLSIPSGPTERNTVPAPYIATPYDYNQPRHSNADTKAGTPSGGAEPTPNSYQLDIIGGFTDGFHFYPAIVNGDTATLQPHHNLLQYGKSYYVQIDPGVLTADGFAGVTGKAWRFTTKARGPKADATKVVVSADGTGDFNTVQGAVDFTPDHGTRRITILVRNGIYDELVYFRNKANLTIQGEDRDRTVVRYANNEVFNPHPVNIATNEWPGTFPSRRAAFAVDHSDDIHLRNMTIATTLKGQAEGLLLNGSRNILDHVSVIGSGDAIQVNGPTYIVDSAITGDGDSILGRGPIFLERCAMRSNGAFMWIRNTDANHGAIFKSCSFTGTGAQPTEIARAPGNNARTYPFAEVVLLNATLSNISAVGWGPADTGGKLHYWEYDSRDPSGAPVDVSGRAAYSRQLDKSKDAKLISDYSSPAFVLGGWTPRLEASAK
ncbi:MAG TPA: pectinesterase family protein [Asticcacaulis sp.]|nr:pectinesterase family protein [Asticcacaulis sp.]